MGFKLGTGKGFQARSGVISNKLQFNKQANNSHITIPGETIIRTNELGDALGMASDDGNIYINDKIPPGSILEYETVLEEIETVNINCEPYDVYFAEGILLHNVHDKDG